MKYENRILIQCFDHMLPFVGKYSRVVVDDKCGFIDKFGELVTPPIFDSSTNVDDNGYILGFIENKLYYFHVENHHTAYSKIETIYHNNNTITHKFVPEKIEQLPKELSKILIAAILHWYSKYNRNMYEFIKK